MRWTRTQNPRNLHHPAADRTHLLPLTLYEHSVPLLVQRVHGFTPSPSHRLERQQNRIDRLPRQSRESAEGYAVDRGPSERGTEVTVVPDATVEEARSSWMAALAQHPNDLAKPSSTFLVKTDKDPPLVVSTSIQSIHQREITGRGMPWTTARRRDKRELACSRTRVVEGAEAHRCHRATAPSSGHCATFAAAATVFRNVARIPTLLYTTGCQCVAQTASLPILLVFH